MRSLALEELAKAPPDVFADATANFAPVGQKTACIWLRLGGPIGSRHHRRCGPSREESSKWQRVKSEEIAKYANPRRIRRRQKPRPISAHRFATPPASRQREKSPSNCWVLRPLRTVAGWPIDACSAQRPVSVFILKWRMVPLAGLEPATPSLRMMCSTT